MQRPLLIALAGGAVGALFHLSVLAGGPGALILAFLAHLPLFLVGLSLGIFPALAAVTTASLAIALLGGVVAMGVYIVTTAAPFLFTVRQSLLSRAGSATGDTEWYPLGRLLAWLAVYGTGLCIVAALLLSGEGGFEAAISRFVESYLNTVWSSDTPDTSTIRNIIVAYFPAGMIIAWILTVVVNATLAQSLLERFRCNLRATPAYRSIVIPGWAAYVLIAVALASVIGRGGTIGYIGANLIPVWAILYAVVGLAVVHTISYRWPARSFLLAVFYVLILALGWPLIVVAGLGFVEQWAGLRHHYAPPVSGQE